MEKNIQKIELINSYLNKTLSQVESKDFENRLKTDQDFKAQYEEHVIVLEGIKRQNLKTEIRNAKQSYIRNKWLRYFGLASVLIGVIVFVYFNLVNTDSDKEYLKSKLNFESEYIQIFHIPVDSIIEVTGEKGTIIRFNPKDLETISGEPFLGDSLNVELIELTTKQDLLFANTQTLSKDKWLISGGAFKIDIKANNETLVLKQGKTINTRFPKNILEEDMQLFYGERNKKGDLNWALSGVKLEDDRYYTIVYKDTSIIDEVLTRQYGVDTVKDIITVDTLGYLSLNGIKVKYPEIKSFENQKDTLRITERFVYESDTDLDGLRKTGKTTVELVKREDFEKIRIWSKNINQFDVITNEVAETYVNYTNRFYKSVQLSKLGWINIDKFVIEEAKVNIKLNFNINTSYNHIYIVDQKNNTVLNVYNDEVDLPINRSFYIIVIGIKGKTIYGYKKSVRFNKNSAFNINYKKINEAQIKSILTLDSLVDKPFSSNESKTNSTSILDSITIQKLDKPKENIVDVKALEAPKKKERAFEYKKEPQAFTINAKKDTTLICKEGTKLIIKANSFVGTNNKSVEGLISLKVTEYYKLSNMLLANLTTQSDGKQLETGGMLFIEAKKAKTNLKLKASSSIEIVFPAKKKDMQLFTGEQKNGVLNWKLESHRINDLLGGVESETIEIIGEPEVEVPFAIIEQVPVYPGCESLDKALTRKCTSDKIEKLIQRRFNTEIAVNLGLKGRQRINTVFKIDKYGNITNIRSRASHPKLEEEANRVIALLPKMQPGVQRGETVGVPYSLPIIFEVEGRFEDIRIIGSNSRAGQSIKDSKRIKDIERKLVSKDSTRVSITEVNNYILKTSKLGWINCDRFVRSRENIKYKLKIKNSEGAIINMVFKSINSVMPSWKNNEIYDFRTVSKGKDIVLVAIKKHKNKLYLDVVETKTDVNPTIDFHFKEVTYKELKNKLRKLDNLF